MGEIQQDKIDADRQLIADAHRKGILSTFRAYTRLSGPGWLQSAITLGSGSLAGALFLGVLGGTSLLWLQLVAIIMGVVMLSAISYVALSTGERPFRAINSHINPVLGWGWLIATCMANMIWCMPQFSVSFGALQENLASEALKDTNDHKFLVSGVLLAAAMVVVLMNSRKGLAARLFDYFLKALVGMIVLSFFGAVIYLGIHGHLQWGKIIAGFIPDFLQWNHPAGELTGLINGLPTSLQEFWTGRIVKEQRAVMIAAAATAVGINMTFLLPYSMLNRGWDKAFRGLARFDLCTGLAIPYIVVTSCIVIASAATFHAKIDDSFKSQDVSVMKKSPLFAGALAVLQARVKHEMGEKGFAALSNQEKGEEIAALANNKERLASTSLLEQQDALKRHIGEESFATLSEQEQLEEIAGLSDDEKRLASSLVRRDAFELSKALAPLLGEKRANLIFGVGVLAMGFSSIVILMLINGYAFSEIANVPQGGKAHVLGCLVAGLAGAAWPLLWNGPAKLWLAILTSSFGMMLLPIAYFTFFMMMNSRRLLGEDKPTGGRMAVWNVLMAISVAGALVAATTAIIDKASHPTAGPLVITVAAVYVVLVIAGFFIKRKHAVTN